MDLCIENHSLLICKKVSKKVDWWHCGPGEVAVRTKKQKKQIVIYDTLSRMAGFVLE